MSNLIKNGFINENYSVIAVEADCFGESVTFFICAKRMNEFHSRIDIILRMENEDDRIIKYEVCESYYRDVAYDIESVTNFAEEYLKNNALELYARLKRRLQAGKPCVSFSYYNESRFLDDYEHNAYEDYSYDEDEMCITIPCNILGKEVCDIVKTSDGECRITFDEKENAVKIYHSVVGSNDRIRQRYFNKGIKIGETSVRTFLNSTDLGEDLNDYDDEQELYDKNFEEEAKQILSMFKSIEDTSEETTAVSKEDAVLV